jgi:DNA-binding NarL/FixJ family response regulator
MAHLELKVSPEMPRACAVLLAEPNFLLREKIAGVLARHKYVWCVVQVDDQGGLVRGAANLCPDIILVDLGMAQDREIVDRLRLSAPTARIVALSDAASQPYLEKAYRLGFDGLREKSLVGEEIVKEICALRKNRVTTDAEPT